MRRYAILTVVLLASATQAFPQAKQPIVKSRGEGIAVNAMLAAPDPAARIRAANELLAKYADTEFKGYALYLEAEAYLQMGDTANTIVYGEQALEADPKNYQAAVLLATTYANTTKDSDLDKEEKLTKVTKYASDVLEALKTATNPNPRLSDAEWTAAKREFEGQCYYALGMVAVYHNKMDDAAADFQRVADQDTDATDLIRAGRALLLAKKYEQAIVWFDRAASSQTATEQIKKLAAIDKARAQAMLKR